VTRLGTMGLALIALATAGCSSGLSSLLGGGSAPAPSADRQIPVNNQLALPPDLSLAPPGTGTAPQQIASVDDGVETEAAPVAPVKRAAPLAPTQDVYEKYGISKLNPDGTPKKDGVLRNELRKAVIAEKRKTNPNYGTIFNAGELFNDN
jgi:hypothetical protein